jgi:para-nitrobenzyl esterase
MNEMSRREVLKKSLAGAAVGLAASQYANRAVASETTVASPTVETQYGKVRGATVRGVHIFKGVPYGGKTEGAARFLPPAKPEKWTGVREATKTMARCVQGPTVREQRIWDGAYFRGANGRLQDTYEPETENCLALNVLTPGLKGRRPVMVHIHGGGFSMMSTLETQFADGLPRDEDVVLVGICHRLNVFGYLYLGGLSERYAVGNPGQLDLILALEWVRDNISQFGGEPENVMVFGESGGGAKISSLLGMPGAKGLFHRAIVESGSFTTAQDPDSATALAKVLLMTFGLGRNQISELQKIPAVRLYEGAMEAAQSLKLYVDEGSAQALMGFGPVLDGHSIPQQPWDPKAPEISANIPMIIGCCKDEPSEWCLVDDSLWSLNEAGLRARIVKAGIPEAEVDPLLAVYHRDHPEESPSDLYLRIASDRGFRRMAFKQAELKAEQGKANVYMYYFAWDTPVTYAGHRAKAFHTAEISLAMRVILYPESDPLSRQIAGAWAAFARSGNPNHAGLPEWPPFTLAERATMVFDLGKSRVVNDPDGEERRLLQNRPGGLPR